MDDKAFHIRVPKRWIRVGLIVAVTALIVAPLTAIASHSFTDVPDGNTFHDDIAWLADANVTRGCNPSEGNTEFCPGDDVTREQMAAFMRRFAQYLGAEDGTPAQADNAAMLGGDAPTAYQTRVWARSCGIEPSGGMNPSTCLPNTSGELPMSGVAEVLAVQINAPASGTLQLSSTGYPSFAAWWTFTLDQTCNEAEFFIRAVNGILWGTNDPTGASRSTSAVFATSISGGQHTLRLCAANTSGEVNQIPVASLTAQWTAGGDVVTSTGGVSGTGLRALPDN